MTVRAFVLTVLTAPAFVATALAQSRADFVKPVAVVAAAQTAQPAPAPQAAPAQSGPGRATSQGAPPPAPVAPAPRSRTPTDEPPPPPPPPPGPTAPPATGQPVNVKIDLTITDQRSGTPPVTRTLSLVVADRQRGMVRSGSDVNGVGGGVSLNVDAYPTLIAGGKIRVYFTLQYDSPGTAEQLNGPMPRGVVVKTSTNESVSLVLEDGKPIVGAQSADPITDRKVSVEVKATILK